MLNDAPKSKKGRQAEAPPPSNRSNFGGRSDLEVHPAHSAHAAAAPIGIAGLSSGISLTAASVVISRPATEAASWSAVRTTLVGSITPAWTRFS